MHCFHPLVIRYKNKPFKKFDVVSCGQCFACRINRTSRATVRLLAEQTYYDKTCFLTLTYDEDHLESPSLIYDHLAKFWRDLRYDLGKDSDLKYYAVGEYGDQGGESKFGFIHRPHFHAIVFGLGTDKTSRELVADNWRYCSPDKFYNPLFSGVASASRCSMQYVAGYIQKKFTGSIGKQKYEEVGLAPPDNRVSQGIGYRYFKKNIDLLRPDGSLELWNGNFLHFDKKFLERIGFTPSVESEIEWRNRVASKYHSEEDIRTYGLMRSYCYSSYLDMRKHWKDYANSEENFLANRTIKLSDQGGHCAI